MIFGDCPNCKASVCNYMAEPMMLERIVCEECEKPYWLLHSRLTPVAVTEDWLLERATVDAETKAIKPFNEATFLDEMLRAAA